MNRPSYKSITSDKGKIIKYLAIAYATTTITLSAVIYGQSIRTSKLAGRYLEAVNHINGLTNMIQYQWEQANKPRTTKTISDMITDKFGPDSIMHKVAKCESGLNPNAKNKVSTARGLFQVMASVHGVNEKWLYNPEVNIAIAKQLYDRQGLTPWISSRSCWSK